MNNSSAISLPPPRFLPSDSPNAETGTFLFVVISPFFILGSTFNTLSLISVYYIRFFNLVDEEEEKNEGRGGREIPRIDIVALLPKTFV